MTYKCPLDPTHESDDPVHCSICGATMPALHGDAAQPAADTVSGASADNGTGQPPIAVVLSAPEPALAPHPNVEMVESLPAADSGEADKMRARLELIVTVDPTIYVRPNTKIPCPVDTPPRRFALTRATTMIGRFSERRDTVPEIALGDPGISRRHAAVVQETDGTVTLSDVGSTNGTQINGKDVMPGSRVALCAGDEIVIGFWTRITVRPAVGLPP